MDARAHPAGLVGKTIHTIGQEKPNRILAIGGTDVIVATDKSLAGQPVPIAEIQTAIEILERDSDVRLDVKTVGYRSAFIGAVLATLPEAIVSTNPRRVRLARR